MNDLPGYEKILHFGHRAIIDILDGPVVVQEKTDGSQFSFGVRGGEFFARSRSVAIDVDDPPALFAPAVAHLRPMAHLMPDGHTFRGECISKPRHNTLNYDRAPRGYVVLFDVDAGLENYVDSSGLEAWAEKLGVEVVPVIYSGAVDGLPALEAMLDRVSVLGGQKIEGIVIKNYGRFRSDGKVMMAKIVRPDFREKNDENWAAMKKPGQLEITTQLVASLRTVPRWRKAVEHMRDRGELAGSPADIGPLLKELSTDIEAECAEEIKDVLYAWARADVLNGVKRGFAEWYKGELAQTKATNNEEQSAEASQS